MEELLKEGVVKNIGVSNFNSKQVQRILDNSTVKPVVNQVTDTTEHVNIFSWRFLQTKKTNQETIFSLLFFFLIHFHKSWISCVYLSHTILRCLLIAFQIEIHPFFNNKKIVEFCQDKGIIVTAFSPFASPDRPWYVFFAENLRFP